MGIHLIYGLRVIHMTKTKGTKAVKPIYLLKAIPPVLFIKLQWRVSLDPKELYKLENGDLPVALAVGQLAIALEGSTERTRRYYYDRWLRIQFVSRLHLG